jgi:hypothetical protein
VHSYRLIDGVEYVRISSSKYLSIRKAEYEIFDIVSKLIGITNWCVSIAPWCVGSKLCLNYSKWICFRVNTILHKIKSETLIVHLFDKFPEPHRNKHFPTHFYRSLREVLFYARRRAHAQKC